MRRVALFAAVVFAASTAHAEPDPGAPKGTRFTPPICTAAGWCWHLPAPVGYAIRGVWAASERDVWAVGMAGMILHFDGARWTWDDSAGAAHLRGVWGSGPADVWAVGGEASEEKSAVFRWDGKRWSRWFRYLGPPLIAVWGTGPDDVWLMPEKGMLAHFDGQQVKTMAAPTKAPLLGLSGSGPADLWLVAEDGVWVWNDVRWSRPKVPAAVARRARAVLVSAPGDVWLADDEGHVHHREPGGRLASSTLERFGRPFFARTGATLWYSNVQSSFRWTGDAWQETPHDTKKERLMAIGGVAADGAWAVGQSGALLRNQGGERWKLWSGRPHSDRGHPQALWGSSDKDVWAVGAFGPFLAHYDGEAWTDLTDDDTPALSGIWGAAANDVWAVGDGILHWDGHAWSPMPDLPQISLDEVWGTSSNDVWASGRGGVLRWDGCRWSPARLNRKHWFGAGGARAANDVRLIGWGAIERWDGSTWHQEKAPGIYKLKDISGNPAIGLWAIDEGGAVFRGAEGGAWTHVAALPPGEWHSIRGVGPDSAWVLGKDGALARLQGGTSTTQPYPFGGVDWKVWISPEGRPWLWGSGDVVSGPVLGAGPAVQRQPVARKTCEPPVNPAPAPVLASMPPLTVAHRWLTALREGDLPQLRSMTRVPFQATGTFLESSWLRVRCGGPPERERMEGTRPFHAAGMVTEARDAPALSRTLTCVMRDTMLTEYLPEAEAWNGGPEGITGTLRVVTVSKLAPGLRRYRPALKGLDPSHTLIQGVATDHNGVTNSVLVVVAPQGDELRVAALYVDELFEE